jgi:hypothetical protein
VRVAEGRVGDEQLLLLERPFGEFFRAQFQQQLARARRRRLLAVVGRRRAAAKASLGETLGLRIAVDDDIAEKGQQLGGAVAARLELEQLRRGVNQRGGGLAPLRKTGCG